MHRLGEGFGEAVGERLDEDRGIIVVGVREALGDRVILDAGRDDEGADDSRCAVKRPDEIGERDIGAAVAPGELLAKREEGRDGATRNSSA